MRVRGNLYLKIIFSYYLLPSKGDNLMSWVLFLLATILTTIATGFFSNLLALTHPYFEFCLFLNVFLQIIFYFVYPNLTKRKKKYTIGITLVTIIVNVLITATAGFYCFLAISEDVAVFYGYLIVNTTFMFTINPSNKWWLNLLSHFVLVTTVGMVLHFIFPAPLWYE